MKKSLIEQVTGFDISRRIEGVRVGKITNIDGNGQVFVDYPGNPQGPMAARFTSSVKLQNLRYALASGQEVLILFENNDSSRPIIIDTLSSLIDEIAHTESVELKENPEDVTIDGKTITFDAQEDVVIRCGQGSITVNKSGKIILKGTNLLSRSSGSNRIKGASVNIN